MSLREIYYTLLKSDNISHQFILTLPLHYLGMLVAGGGTSLFSKILFSTPSLTLYRSVLLHFMTVMSMWKRSLGHSLHFHVRQAHFSVSISSYGSPLLLTTISKWVYHICSRTTMSTPETKKKKKNYVYSGTKYNCQNHFYS